MAETTKLPNKVRVRWGRVLVWSFALVLLQAAAIFLLTRLQLGKLFLLALPWDAPATPVEIAEAAAAAKSYQWPAMLVITVIWLLLAIGSKRQPSHTVTSGDFKQFLWRMRWGFALFLIGTIADIATTMAFFHRDGVDQELHPGIRLVSYALGRSVGPLATKLIQFAGVVLIALRWRKVAPYLLTAAGAIYLLGAIYNVWVSFN